MPLTLAYYTFDDPAYACARLRVLEPIRALGPAVRLLPGVLPQGPGHAVTTEILDAADVILIQRYFPGPQTASVLDTIFSSGKPVVYDTDDDWTTVAPGHLFFSRIGALLPHILNTIRRANLVTVSTATLAEALRPYNSRIRVLPNLLPEALWKPVAPPTRPVVAIGLAATASHQTDLGPLETALAELEHQHGDTIRFVFYGCPPVSTAFPKATVLPFATDYAAYARKLPRLGCAIGLAPLADTPFNRAKSPIKWMEYAASGMAGIFADLPPYRDVVIHEETGLLVGPRPEDWAKAVARLAKDGALRHRIAVQAMEAVARQHLLSREAYRYLDAWTLAAQGNAP
ncbi:MAG: glycosyltransferase [Solidesulfovibrio sp.]